MNEQEIRSVLNSITHIDQPLLSKMLETSTLMEVNSGDSLMREGQYIKVIPLVLNGLVKVYTRYKEKELLLYYIKPAQSCIMSFSCGIINEASRIFAVAEEDSTLLLLPVDEVVQWIKSYPSLNNLFFQQFNLRYIELLETINHLIYDKLDQRLYNFLKERGALTGKNPIQISHRMIAQELGTSREVITRTLKKLEAEEKVKQEGNSIKIL